MQALPVYSHMSMLLRAAPGVQVCTVSSAVSVSQLLPREQLISIPAGQPITELLAFTVG